MKSFIKTTFSILRTIFDNLRILTCSRKVCGMFVEKHTETIVHVKYPTF